MEMGRRANKGQESLCSCGEDRLHSFYWFPPSPPPPRPWCGWSWRRVFLLITGIIVRAATRLWKQPCDHRPEAPDWCSLFDGGSAFSGRPAERPPFKGLWRPKVSMVVTTVSHCFWTILDGARFYDSSAMIARLEGVHGGQGVAEGRPVDARYVGQAVAGGVRVRCCHHPRVGAHVCTCFSQCHHDNFLWGNTWIPLSLICIHYRLLRALMAGQTLSSDCPYFLDDQDIEILRL